MRHSRLVRSDFAFSKNLGESIPNVATLLTELQANEDKVEDLLDTLLVEIGFHNKVE